MKIRVSDIKDEFLLLILLLNGIVSSYIDFFSYLDEIIVVWSLVYIIWKIGKNNLKKSQSKVILFSISIIIVGVIGLIHNSFQSSIIAVIKDLILLLKLPLVTLAVIIYTDKRQRLVNELLFIRTIYILIDIIFLCGLISLFMNIGMSQETDIRFGFHPYQFLFSYPTFLAYALFFMSIVLVVNKDKNKRISLRIQLEILFLLVITMRDKAFAYVLLYILLIFIIPNRKKIKLRYFVLAAVGAFAISYDKIMLYRSFSWSPRFALYSTSYRLLLDNFPFGSGFASFGSSVSGEYYSRLYSVYNLSGKFTAENYITLSDAQWPYYIGQFGFIGLIIFGVMLVYLFKLIKERCKNENAKKALYLVCGYLMIAALAESVFTNESGATVAFALLYFTNSFSHRIKNELSNNFQ